MLQRLKKSTEEKDQGFTLIELLVVIVIVGILAAIAIPIFLNQREKAVDAGIESDLKAAATAQETYFVDEQTYATKAADLTDFKISKGNVIKAGGDDKGYCISGSNPGGSADGTAKTYYYDSEAGGLDTSGTMPSGACSRVTLA